ncbi:transketolase family protein [Maridesulfovibrio salexigens]|uniref:Transketolase domain protein n=1 Tax=Maridesulfovibrio salexigens (strain ATCC 14822 / DSM 2638 / NCIMB 8403 / VKM B-1763) TaxID=526222 RepID=C6BXR7_MARSD|nr:transketolase C-terminal domain-containing protein [Maridesulfovibrio salexigens]ACS78625.1 Transketolase domain protein [Maridesulfovibrio salexigens DSM 2638]
MRKACLEQVYQLAKKDERVVFVGSDLGAGTLSHFQEEMPERFFMEGIAEAHAVGMACGMAHEGKVVYVNTIQSFLTRRCYEQLLLDACLHNLNVRFIGNGGGLVYAPLGTTHWATEDISILRVMPNLTVLSPADAEEMDRLMPHTLNHQGPIFIRLAKGYDPIVTEEDSFKIGKAYPYREGGDMLLIGCGVMLGIMKQAGELLEKAGIEASILHLPTIKPLDTEAIISRARKTRAVITVEENTTLGGLGSAIAEILAEACLPNPLRMKRIGLPDSFSENYGSQLQHFAHNGLTAENIVNEARKLLT